MTNKWINWKKEFASFANDKPLFVPENKTITGSTLNNVLRNFLNTLGIEYVSFHKLRHTHASILIAKGVSLQVVAKRLGHTDTTMVQTIYGHLLKSVEETENKKIMDIL
jgi:integrase